MDQAGQVPRAEGRSVMTTAAMDKKTAFTYEDYARLPEGSPYQLIGGELVMTPSPTPYHQQISRRIELALVKFVETKDAGEVLDAPLDVHLSGAETYQPDIIFIAKERANIIGEKKIEAAPDLVVEILSPSTAYYDLRHKMRVYEATGVKEYWIVDPMEKTVEVFENMGKEFKLFSQARSQGVVQSKLLTGFEVAVEKVF
jgi:Uma2 family endonuclease